MKPTIFPENDYFYPALGESTRLLVGCRAEDYSASRIAHAVEDCNAHLLNLNITTGFAGSNTDADDEGTNPYPVLIDIRVSLRNAASIARSLERYGYHVLDALEPLDGDDDTSRERYLHLLRYLEM